MGSIVKQSEYEHRSGLFLTLQSTTRRARTWTQNESLVK